MIDRTSKILLAIIALGIWTNIAREALAPAPANAQESYFADMTRYLRVIANGNCNNSKLC